MKRNNVSFLIVSFTLIFAFNLRGEEGVSKNSRNISLQQIDNRLQSYIEEWLYYEYSIETGSVTVNVKNGVVTLDGVVSSDRQLSLIPEAIRSIKYVEDVISHLKNMPTGKFSRWQSWSKWVSPHPGKRKILFPRGDIFASPISDPKQVRSYVTWQRYHTEYNTYNIASVGFGDEIGLARWPGEYEGDGVQLGVSGAVFAIFNLDALSTDLMNADYVIGFPLSIRRDAWSGRLRIYHQSSHLGDEFILTPQAGPVIERINLSYEALEFIGSWEMKKLRVYGGYSYIIETETPLDRNRLQGGLEYRFTPKSWRRASFISGIDMKGILKESQWTPDISFKIGVMYNNPYDEIRSLQIFLEYYKGHSTYGQFSKYKVDYFGLGISFAI